MSEKKIMLVSVVHNRKQYLKEALDSATKSSLDTKHFVHLIIDSGSTQPECREIIKEHCDEHDNAYYKFFDENINQMKSYNWALEWRRKNFKEIKYFCCLDSDDRIGKFALQRAIETFEEFPQVGLVYSNFHMMDDKGRISLKNHPKSKQVPKDIEILPEGQKIMRSWQVKLNMMTHLRAMRICEIEKIGFDERYPFSTDFSLYCSMMDIGVIVKKIGPEALYLWRNQGLKKKALPTVQVEKDHGGQQRSDFLALKEYYTEKWKKEGKI